jgi:CheY-like chemotaxis protein
MSLSILVVDDNRDTLRTYTKALRRKITGQKLGSGLPERATSSLLEVDAADTVPLALKKLHEQPFDILVVDLKIPGSTGEEMGGLELIWESMKLDPLRPIIAITGYGSVELARKTLTRGVFDFIEKSGTAVDDLINAIQRAIDSRDEKILRSGNPFAPMTGQEPTVFGGRTRELEFFEERLYRAVYSRFCEHFLVLGDWGIGKSTLFKEYKKICQSRRYLAARVPLEPLQSGTSLGKAARSLVGGILRDLPYPVDRFRRVAAFFDSVGINVLGTGLQFSRDTSKKELSPQSFLHDTFQNLWQDLEDKSEVLVILLDDLENFLPVSEIFMTLKQTLSMDSMMKTRILVGIASNPTSWLELTSAMTQHHPLSRFFLPRVELGPLGEDEVRETVLKSVIGTGVSFGGDVIKRVFEYTQGHPFEMQVLCYHLFNSQLSRRVEIDVWDKAFQNALNDMSRVVFECRFNQASNEESKILYVVAMSEEPIATKQIRRLAEEDKLKVPVQNAGKYLQRLVEKKLISKSGRGLYNIPDPMFRAYICTRLSEK